MASKKRLVKDLEKNSRKFLDKDQRKILLDSLKKDKTKWYEWVYCLKAIFKNLDKIETAQFAGLTFLLEQNQKSDFHKNNLNKFLIDKVEYYRHYDFSLERELTKEEKKRKKIWISKVMRLFISRSFLGILILLLILAFILWFYIDRESCLEFVREVVDPFLKAIR